MGVQDLNAVLKMFGIVATDFQISPGTPILIDAMMQLYMFHAIAEPEFLGARPTSKFFDSYATLKTGIMASVPHMTREQCFHDDGQVKIEALVADVNKSDPWVKMRVAIATRMFEQIMQLKAGGLIPVLVWDGSILGKPRTEGKLPRPPNPLLLRNVDKLYIYVALKAAGVASVVADDEGERFACAAARAIPNAVVMSRDTDCIVLGAPRIANSIIPIAGKGGFTRDGYQRNDIAVAISTRVPGVRPSQVLMSAAMFLGCDFCARKRGNGPVTFFKQVTNGVLYDDPEAHLVRKFFTLDDAFLAHARNAVQCSIDDACQPDLEMLEIIGFSEVGNCEMAARPFQRAVSSHATPSVAQDDGNI